MKFKIIQILFVILFSAFVLFAQTTEQWRADLRFLAEEMPKQHKNLFHTMTRGQFESAVKKLDEQIPELSRQQIIVEMARIVAMVEDGHTILSPARDPKIGFRTFPIKLYVFDDGIFVRAVTREQSKLIGARLVKIGNVSIGDAYKAVSQLIGRDNEMDNKFYAPFLLVMPEVLNGLGLIDEMENVKFTFEKEDKQWTVELKPFGKAEMVKPDTDNSWLPKDGWIDARDNAKSPTPLWLKDPNNKFWFEYLPDSKTLYFQLNEVGNKDDETLEAFIQKLFAFIESNPVDKFVLDLRLNRGGNNYLNRSVLLGIIRATKLDQKGKFFTIIGRGTWSAAQHLTNDLEELTNTTFVGEPSGGKVNSYGDSRKIILPNSEITVRVSTLWWQKDERDKRQWTSPNVAADLTFADYAKNIDPAMQAIINYRSQKSLSEVASELLQANDLNSLRNKAIEYKNNPLNKYQSFESEINTFGYSLVRMQKMKEALEIFKLNTELYPESANAFDSLGETYANQGNKEEAIKSYEKALQIDPKMPSAINALRRLKGQ